jgi:hypothetical protein
MFFPKCAKSAFPGKDGNTRRNSKPSLESPRANRLDLGTAILQPQNFRDLQSIFIHVPLLFPRETLPNDKLIFKILQNV